MTQKDYIKIAAVLRETKPTEGKFILVSRFSHMLKANNPKFDTTKFYKEVFAFKVPKGVLTNYERKTNL